ncbi:UDP-N-acetylmuramate:L-alanyl-gamma-D-glutamyl- meso-diaminopimelate ligase [Methylophaga frappieri]|jgi:UDP-N-acetylmuramate: L-alanyl-gamma-D-glutamyl-meso-diaminopimelate ligase|uniref:UDP-N-acetylmuramate--L-alanyl-gamma-D-glutamyl-meso-2,6-diaminoheptandioate ligase n=2 Tax=Gammaproteobacteria TaxID=1236 RepID=K6YQ15_9ALTE|nr:MULTISPECIES: UDP-N-acetylmuramate:L-alanyl-gamma-D-glutamyl-meso-diaminopimelate ligase [Gammaproteobacteria]AFJ01664.1 UDP-N-acetylmuramate:L-alanyl-gamma-D-glutamyl- meso-diaminopimelate ligase [Methylophaga frappieri]GAC13410.1 UDP-N-acetylmuramate: L-alanyl-gamma-D-glutamyl-meso-diaminopimelate ligase [Aliiglaciecola lipolytica E3]
MHIHILGICGTFMGGLAILARQLGHQVTGSDSNVYPPMSTQLEEQGITLVEGFDPIQLEPAPDLVVVGNAMSRGNPCVEYILDKGLKYTSGPQWLSEHLLQDRWVLAAAGTHGKTTTSSMLAWILEDANMAPGFLIGGVPADFGVSARVGDSPFFVIEADEYDSAFFDKRSKFVHYRPRTAILNNLEFDHADIFEDLAAIQKQFHHLVRTIPSTGRVLLPASNDNLETVLSQGLWSEVERCSIDDAVCKKPLNNAAANIHHDVFDQENTTWSAQLLSADGSAFAIFLKQQKQGEVHWSHTGNHNVSNALSAIAAARHVGVTADIACQALSTFKGVKRRMELLAVIAGISVYDDFAHHPTAIATTLAGQRAKIGEQRLIAVIEPRSNTMRLGTHLALLADASCDADRVIWYQPKGLDWSLEQVIADSDGRAEVFNTVDSIVANLVAEAKSGDHIVIMSNGGFGGIHGQLLQALNDK